MCPQNALLQVFCWKHSFIFDTFQSPPLQSGKEKNEKVERCRSKGKKKLHSLFHVLFFFFIISCASFLYFSCNIENVPEKEGFTFVTFHSTKRVVHFMATKKRKRPDLTDHYEWPASETEKGLNMSELARPRNYYGENHSSYALEEGKKFQLYVEIKMFLLKKKGVLVFLYLNLYFLKQNPSFISE